MPKISDEKRDARRQQILNAAWACFQREGLHATTMNHIIQESGLSAGAVYSYFKNKEDLIVAAVTTSLSGLNALVVPLFTRDPLPSPAEFVREVTRAIDGFAARDGFDLKRIALLGWSEAQRNEMLRDVMRGFYTTFRNRLADLTKTWQQQGLIEASAKKDDMAKTLMALILGYVVESAIIGDTAPDAIMRGVRGFVSGA